MRDYQPISFLFVTATSGSMERLVERAKLPDKESVINQALHYYSYYLSGAFEGGPCLVRGDMRLEEVELEEIDDDRTPDHHDADTIDMKVDMSALQDLSHRAYKSNLADTLTAALIIYEKIFDALEAGLSIGHFDPEAHRGKGHFFHLMPKQFVPAASRDTPVATAHKASLRPDLH